MKSHASELLMLASCIFKDAYAQATRERRSDILSLRNDLRVIEDRVKYEGLSFLTITLPDFCKEFDRCLSEGQIRPTFFRSFRKKGLIPAFLQGITCLVFDHVTGGLLVEPSIAAIYAIRQCTLAFKKIELECSQSRKLAAIAAYKQDEEDLCSDLPDEFLQSFRAASAIIWQGLVPHWNPDKLLPSHGPGATADGNYGNHKYHWKEWNERLEGYFFLAGDAYAGIESEEDVRHVRMLSEEDEKPVKVIFVPKTLKTPRVIAVEPTCQQYCQQALKKWFYETIETIFPYKGHINFTDSSINQRLALNGSRDGQIATLDMSSASDRVPLCLVKAMLPTEIYNFVEACRSRRAILPNNEIISLRKFASMGSATCFPIEAMYFYTLCIMALAEEAGVQVSRSNWVSFAQRIYVYGDDLIVPTASVPFVEAVLTRYFCKLNRNKSFSEGNFRESCGWDCYDGYKVNPTYIRQLAPQRKSEASRILSRLASSNLFYIEGYWLTADYLKRQVECLLSQLPVVNDRDRSFLCLWTFQRGGRWCTPKVRYHRGLHRVERFLWTSAAKQTVGLLDGHAALTKCLISLEKRIKADPEQGSEFQLERYGLRYAVRLKRSWEPAS